MEKMIETTHLTKRFGPFHAVKDVSLSVGQSEIYGFLGLNGAGKTTTIRMLLGLIRPTEGHARIGGADINPGGKGPWNRVGSLVETPHAYPELTVRDNLEIIRRMRGISNKNAVDEVADKLKLTRYLGKKSGQLSLGNAQRLGLAKALLHKPEVLILDEPTNGLDPSGIVEIRQLLIDLAHNHAVTVFVSSHILDEIARITTRIGVIHEGQLLKEMDPAQIRSLGRRRLLVNTRDNRRAHEILEKQGFTATLGHDTPIELTDHKAMENPDIIASILVQAGIPLTALYEKEDDLESLFMKMIGRESQPHA